MTIKVAACEKTPLAGGCYKTNFYLCKLNLIEQRMSFYTKEKLEFLTVAVETCKYLEGLQHESKTDFVSKMSKLLPLLYLKAMMVPPTALPDDEVERFVTECDYEQMRVRLSELLGESDDYLDSFDADMALSETTLYATISEDLSDMYQSLKDFVCCCAAGNDEQSEAALAVCIDDFKNHWGGRLLGALRALHVAAVAPNDTTDE